MPSRGYICVFAKPPRPGRVKTRLATAIGARGAARLATALLQDTWAAARATSNANVVLATTTQSDLGLPRPVETWLQGNGDLGQRMERILRRALELGPWAAAIGADVVGFPTILFDTARAALARHDAVLAPTEDGGFYLIALRRCPDGLLADLPWSHASTFERTVDRLRDRGLSVEVLDPWFDIDRPLDLLRASRLLFEGQARAPSTKAALEELLTPAPEQGASPSQRSPSLSVIIPTLNEATRASACLEALKRWRRRPECIVVDGGSTDQTTAIARREGSVRVITAPQDAMTRMNVGGVHATAELLLFLPAGAALPDEADLPALRARIGPVRHWGQAVLVTRETFWRVGGAMSFVS